MENYIIKTNGEKIAFEPANKKEFTLKEVQTAVGGYIELIHLNKTHYMIVNEEGKLNQLEANREATSFAYQNLALQPGDFIVGNVAVIQKSKLK
jgi:hypothetical protein